MEVPLDPEIEQIVLQKVASGAYPSVSVLVEEALFLLVERDWSQSQAELQERMPSVFSIESAESTETEGERS
jgi:Arc/MetJ-type ribon-helix-helix transcriptional regulator